MRKTSLVSLGAGILVGATLFGAGRAYADMPTIDVLVAGAIEALSSAATSAITGLGTSLNSTLSKGFTQNANYAKAQVGAHQQITDASNTAMARFHRDVRNRQITDEHTPSPLHCAALDNGQTVVASSGQSWKVATAMQNVSDPRGEADTNQPAYYGAGQALQAINQLHMSRYCSDTESQAGLCSTSQLPNGDQRASSLFGTGTYNGQTGVTAANDYITNLVQPIVPAALRGDQLTSVAGQDEAVHRREYNARMSLAHKILDDAAAMQAPSVALTAQETQQRQNEGLPAEQQASWLEALTLDVERRYSDVNWAGQLQAMPPAAVEREVALELAATNYLLLHNLKVSVSTASAAATSLAVETERSFQTPGTMTTPSMTGSSSAN